MEEKEIAEKLESAALKETGLEANMRRLRPVLLAAAAKKGAKSAVLRYITAFAAIAAASLVTFHVVDDMNDGSRFNKKGGMWSTFSDAAIGGDSVVWPPESFDSESPFVMSAPGYGETGWAVRITGTSGEKMGFNYNYLGVLVRFTGESACPACAGTDISRYRGVRFKIKGSLPGGELVFILPYESEQCDTAIMSCESMTGYADYQADITGYVTPVWTTVALDFEKDLKQPFWVKKEHRFPVKEVLKSAHLFKWQYKNGAKGRVVDIWIDDVELY
ncbi:MAG TPA: hypothetical protein ENN43_06030 [bacterium]|nr:hypothetical protein [bacterium]